MSVNYRHGPEDRFPAAADDAFAALQWVAAHATELGGIPGQLVVAGWSAGGNVAAVAAQRARDEGGPRPRRPAAADAGHRLRLHAAVVRRERRRLRADEAADGLVLGPLRDPADRTDPRVAPLRAADLSGLPPAFIVTCEFDPLRDEGNAYAEALAAAGVPVTHVQARGHTHTSLTMVDVIAVRAPPAARRWPSGLRAVLRAVRPGLRRQVP